MLLSAYNLDIQYAGIAAPKYFPTIKFEVKNIVTVLVHNLKQFLMFRFFTEINTPLSPSGRNAYNL